jgi:hypothetical protein
VDVPAVTGSHVPPEHSAIRPSDTVSAISSSRPSSHGGRDAASAYFTTALPCAGAGEHPAHAIAAIAKRPGFVTLFIVMLPLRSSRLARYGGGCSRPTTGHAGPFSTWSPRRERVRRTRVRLSRYGVLAQRPPRS